MNARMQILNSRKHLIFLIIGFILQSSMAIPNNNTFPLQNVTLLSVSYFSSSSSGTIIYSPPVCFSGNSTTSFFSSITYTAFLIMNTVFLMILTFSLVSLVFPRSTTPDENTTPDSNLPPSSSRTSLSCCKVLSNNTNDRDSGLLNATVYLPMHFQEVVYLGFSAKESHLRENWIFKSFGIKGLNPRIERCNQRNDKLHNVSTNTIPADCTSLSFCNNYCKKLEVCFGVPCSVFIFAKLGYMIAEFRSCKVFSINTNDSDSVGETLCAAKRKDRKLRCLKAAEVAKRRQQEKENKRKVKKEAFMAELSRRKRKTAEEMERKLIEKQEAFKNKEAKITERLKRLREEQKTELVAKANQKQKFEKLRAKNATSIYKRPPPPKVKVVSVEFSSYKYHWMDSSTFEIDEVYENFDAPQWTDLSADNDPFSDDWFGRDEI